VAYLAGVSDESHRDAMSDAIRAQRERGNVPKSMLPPEDEPAAREPEAEPEAVPEPAAKRSFLSRLFSR